MIKQTKNNFSKGVANLTIAAGYIVAVIAVLNYVLLQVLEKPYMSHWIWLLIIPMSAILFYVGRKNDKKAIVKTHIDRIVKSVWIGYVLSIILLLIVICSSSVMFRNEHFMLVITPLILVLIALAQFIVATACRFRPYYYSALIFALGSLACLASYYWEYSSFQFIILAITMVLGFVIPGNMFNKKVK